jgi:hypothetical protein
MRMSTPGSGWMQGAWHRPVRLAGSQAIARYPIGDRSPIGSIGRGRLQLVPMFTFDYV